MQFALNTLCLLIVPASGDELVYSTQVWNGDPNTERESTIRTISDTGYGDSMLLNLGGDTTYPHFSADGQWLYFQSDFSGQYEVYRSLPDGSQVTQVGDPAAFGAQYFRSYGYSLSGDSSKMVYTIFDGIEAKAVYANADGSDAQLVAPQLGFTYMASLNQSGNQVVFSGPAENYELLTASVPNGQPSILTPDLPQSYVPQFTPDGKTVVFLRIDGNIYSEDLATLQVHQLTQNNGYVELHWNATDQHGSSDGPSISPDGQHIAYIGLVNGVAQVFTMNLDGTNQRQLTFGSTDSGRVVWSPDGKELAFVTFINGYPQLFDMPSTGGTPLQLTNVPGGGVYWVQWEPTTLPGDFNHDGMVNAADYSILMSHWQQSGVGPSGGDLSGDGTVGIEDFALFKDDYLAANGSGASFAVPEPSSLATTIVALIAVGRWRKRERATARHGMVG
ncbi:MAG TPA: dockerin type I domain-containing protein [Pirellulales bacterium]|nr:dockerin type I domain-containing protein [Pirellulales bacterium]